MTDEELAAVKSRAETIAGDRRLTRWAPHFTAGEVLVLVAEVERLHGIIDRVRAGLAERHDALRAGWTAYGDVDYAARAEEFAKLLRILDGEEQS